MPDKSQVFNAPEKRPIQKHFFFLLRQDQTRPTHKTLKKTFEKVHITCVQLFSLLIFGMHTHRDLKYCF